MFNIDEYLQIGLSRNLNGKSLDKWMTALSPQINDGARFLRFDLKSSEHLQSMIADADDTFVLRDGLPIFCCCYDMQESCPVSRIYFYRVENPFLFESVGARLKRGGFKLNNILSHQDFLEKVQSVSAPERIKKYKENHQKSLHLATAKELAKGRHRNTFVKETTLLRTDGCLLCGALDVILITATWGTSSGQSMQFVFCMQHASEAFREKSVLNYLAEKSGIPLRLPLRLLDRATDSDYFSETICHVDQTLECDIKEIKEAVREITGVRRRSGFLVIIRLHSNKKRGYAYMVNLPNNVQVARIDDAADHLDISFFPDHRHTGLPKENKSAEPSFTTGHARIDLPGIKLEIEKIEEKYKEHWIH